MNIGIDSRTYKYRTGIGSYVANNIEQLNIMDKENNYVLYSPDELELNFKLNDNFKVREKIGGKLKFYFKLPKMLKEDKIDVYWGTNYILPRKVKGIKYVLTIHDLAIKKLKTIGSIKTTLVQKIFLKSSIKKADKIIADSNATKNDIIQFYKIDEEKITVCYLGTNYKKNELEITEEIKNKIENKFRIKNIPFLLFVSTIEPRKNIETLIKAYEYIREKEKINLRLIIAGGKGWKYNGVIELIKKSRYKDDIEMTGFISNEEKYFLYKNTECFVYPSLYEGFGLPILEAFSNEALVITSNNSSLPEVGGDAAFYFDDVLNYEELGDKIAEVINLDEKEKKIRISKGIRTSTKI